MVIRCRFVVISLVISLALRHRDAVLTHNEIYCDVSCVYFKISSMQKVAWMYSGAVRALGRRLDAISVRDPLESDSLNQSFFSFFYPFLLPWGVGINLPFSPSFGGWRCVFVLFCGAFLFVFCGRD